MTQKSQGLVFVDSLGLFRAAVDKVKIVKMIANLRRGAEFRRRRRSQIKYIEINYIKLSMAI